MRELAELGDKARDRALERFRVLQPHIEGGPRAFAANAVRLQLYALAYNLGTFMRTLAMPKRSSWPRLRCRDRCSPTSCR